MTDANIVQPDMIFELQDTEGPFSVSIDTLIECLQVAEQLALIPELPDEWKDQIPDMHRVEIER